MTWAEFFLTFPGGVVIGLAVVTPIVLIWKTVEWFVTRKQRREAAARAAALKIRIREILKGAQKKSE